MTELLEILARVKPHVQFTENTENIITDELLDSIDIVELVGELNDEFDIEIKVTDMVPENFESTVAIMNMIKRLEDED